MALAGDWYPEPVRRPLAVQKSKTVDAELGMFTALDKIDFSRCCGSLQRAYEKAFW